MKRKTNTPLYMLITLFLISGMLASCKKDEDTGSGLVELHSFGPAGVKHGEEITFIGRNLDKVTEIVLTGASVAKADFLEQTREKIVILVPQSTERGPVTLKSATGEVTSKTPIDFEVAVAVTGFTALVKPGEEMTITGDYVNWITSVQFPDELLVTEFVSRSLNELVVQVPLTAKTGTLVFSTAGTEPVSIESETELQVVLPSITSIQPNPAERGENLTITGTNLDLTREVLFKGAGPAVTEFVSQTETSLVLRIPEEANKGKVSLVAYSDVVVESQESLLFVGDLPDLPPLAFGLYVDGFMNNTQNWGWGTTIDASNTENVRDGESALKIAFSNSWGAFKPTNFSISSSDYREFTFSVFATPGTGGKVINMSVNGGSALAITLEEGKWVEYKFTMAQLGNPANITDVQFQEAGWAGTIYMDHIGFR